MSNEAVKQNFADVARGYVGSLFCVAVRSDPVSAKLRCCRARVSRGRSSNVDNVVV